MKLSLVLVAILQQALCAQQPVGSAELDAALQSQPLQAWIKGIAAKRNISPDAVRAKIQAVTYHLDPAPEHLDSIDGEHLSRRHRRGIKEYPEVYKSENKNGLPETKKRVAYYNGVCRRGNAQPAGSPFTPANNFYSFWRSVSAQCQGYDVKVYCKLPDEFGPSGWNENARSNLKFVMVQCPADKPCVTMTGHGFESPDPVTYAACGGSSSWKRDEDGVSGGDREFFGTFQCPVTESATPLQWDVRAEALDGKDIEWSVFTGPGPAAVSRSPVFMLSKEVEWKGSNSDSKPWVKFVRTKESATVRLYSYLG